MKFGDPGGFGKALIDHKMVVVMYTKAYNHKHIHFIKNLSFGG